MARKSADTEVSPYLGPGTHVVTIAGVRWWKNNNNSVSLKVLLAGATQALRGQTAEFFLRQWGDDLTTIRALFAVGAPGYGGPPDYDDEIDATAVAAMYGRVCVAQIDPDKYTDSKTGEVKQTKRLKAISPLPEDKTAIAYEDGRTWAAWWTAQYQDPKTERTVFPADMLTEAVDELRRVWPDFRPRSAWANLPPQLRTILDKLDGAPVATGAVADAAETPF